MEVRNKWNVFKLLKKRPSKPEFHIQQKYSPEDKIKTFSDGGKLREFIADKLASKEILKDIFQTKGIQYHRKTWNVEDETAKIVNG